MEYDKDSLWDIAKVTYKIQQIREEWEWMIDKTVGQWTERKNILEIGCYDGGSSFYLSNYADKMVTMDWHTPSRFDIAGMHANQYSYIGGDSHDPKNLRKMRDIFNSDERIDMAFIDGDHSFEGVKADFNNVLPYIPSGVPIVFHDIVISDFHHQHGCYVGEFWQYLKDIYKGYKMEEFSTNSEWAGIGILTL